MRMCLLALACLLLLQRGAAAADGLIEISQARALAGGINGDLVADPPGFPVRITQPGSYRLTSNLDLGAAPSPAATDAIRIAASDVALDLAGFAIHWTNECTGGITVPITCTTTGSGDGVECEGCSYQRLRVHRGTIRGVAGSGVSVGDQAIVEDLQLDHVGVYGVLVGNVSRVADNVVRNCGLRGIRGGNSLRVSNNVVDRCRYGITVGFYNRVDGNVANANTFDGIRAGGFTAVGSNLVTDNNASLNGRCGIVLGEGATDPQSAAGGNVVADNVGDPTECPDGGLRAMAYTACNLVNSTHRCPP
jgi:hypothetical protein